jgi:hypothetical protein
LTLRGLRVKVKPALLARRVKFPLNRLLNE